MQIYNFYANLYNLVMKLAFKLYLGITFGNPYPTCILGNIKSSLETLECCGISSIEVTLTLASITHKKWAGPSHSPKLSCNTMVRSEFLYGT